MKKLLQYKLRILAKALIKKYQPIVIGITGSVGKTSTKEAVYTVLSGAYETRRTMKSYNNEIGLPLTIIGVDTGGRNLFKWFRIFSSALKQLIFLNKNYPEVLVLEMAADHEGDIKYLTNIAPCNIGIVTAIAPVHMEYFKSVESIRKEKQIILTHMDTEGKAVYNFDDEELKNIPKLKAESFTYSLGDQNADLIASDIQYKFSEKNNLKYIDGLMGKFQYNDSVVPFYLPGILAHHHIYAALVACAVGLSLDMNLVDISRSLKNYHAPRGRLNLLEGIKNSWIIDDSYNSSPKAVKAALEVLNKFPENQTGKKIAILGDMNELGSYAKKAHEEVGQEVAKSNTQILITYGKLSKQINNAAEKAGFTKENSFHFKTHEDIIKYIKNNINEGDVVLVKGSQTGVRLEKVVKGIMAHPESARELLVRQGKSWEKG